MFICKIKIGNSSSHLSRNGLGQSLGKSGDKKRRHSRSSVATRQFLKAAWATRDLVFLGRKEEGRREREILHLSGEKLHWEAPEWKQRKVWYLELTKVDN